MEPEDDILRSRVVLPEHVVLREFEAETLLLNLETGTYHGLNPTASRIVEVLRRNEGRLETSVDALASEYDADRREIARDVAELCEELLQRGLLERAPR